MVALRQLLEAGLSKSWVYRRMGDGWLHRVWPGVFAVGHSALSWRGTLMAAVLWCGPAAVVSHVPAAALSDLLSSASASVHVTVPLGGRRSQPGVRVHQTRRLDTADRAVIDGIPVTSIARTLADIAAVVKPQRLEQAIEQAERMGRLDRVALEAQLRPGRPGAREVRAALTALDPLASQTHPGIERRFLKLVRQASLPRPEVNVEVIGYEVDFLWRDAKLIVELDSREYHRTPSAFEADRKRDIDLQRAGYVVLRLTHRRLAQEPAVVTLDLRYFLSGAGAPCAP